MSAMKTRATPKQKNKIQIYLRQVGLWNEAIGFVFLALAAGFAVLTAGTSTNDFFGGFIGLFSFAATFEVILWLVIGILYLGTGWYLRKERRNHTTAVLICTILLSVVSILNLIPVLPLILSIVALTKANRLGVNLDNPGKSKKKFNLKRQPDLIVGLVLIGIAIVALGVANTNSSKISEKSGYKLPKIEKAACQPGSTPEHCVIGSAADGFQVVFPESPRIDKSKAFPNPGDEDDEQQISSTTYTYYNNKSMTASTTDVLEILDFAQTPTATDPTRIAEIQKDRLENGPKPVWQFCDSTSNEALTSGFLESEGVLTTFLGFPALQLNMTGKTFDDTKCTYMSMSILKGNKLYTLSYTSIPDSTDKTPFAQFLQSFSLTQ